MFVLGKDMRNILDIRIKHSQIEIGLVFHSRSWVVLFCFFATFLIIFLSCFFFFFAYASMEPAYFVIFSSILVFSLRQAALLSFNSLSFYGSLSNRSTLLGQKASHALNEGHTLNDLRCSQQAS